MSIPLHRPYGQLESLLSLPTKAILFPLNIQRVQLDYSSAHPLTHVSPGKSRAVDSVKPQFRFDGLVDSGYHLRFIEMHPGNPVHRRPGDGLDISLTCGPLGDKASIRLPLTASNSWAQQDRPELVV